MTIPDKTIFLSGAARSGTSWLGQVFNSSPDVIFRFQPLFSYEFKGRVNEDSDRAEYEALFADLMSANTPFLTQADKQASGEYPRFEKNVSARTLVFKDNSYQSMWSPMMRRVPELLGVGLVRHPCATLNSWRNNAKEFPPGSDILKEWRFGNCKNKGNEDYFGYYKWKEITNQYLDLSERFPERFITVRYEDLIKDPQNEVRSLFSFCSIGFSEQTEAFLKTSTQEVHSDSYYGVYKNNSVVDRWRQELPAWIIEEIYDDLKGTRLERFTY
jgi:hypothetical protein